MNNNEEDFQSRFDPYNPAKDIRLIEARIDPSIGHNAKFILIDHRGFQYGIYNKFSTKKYLAFLNNFNTSFTFSFDGFSFLSTSMMSVSHAETGAFVISYKLKIDGI